MKIKEREESNGFTVEEMSKPMLIDGRVDANKNIAKSNYSYEGETGPSDDKNWKGAVIKIDKDEIWFLRENCGGVAKIDIMATKLLRRFFLNEEGGNDLAWIAKKSSWW